MSRILIADDDANLVRSLGMILQDEGYEIAQVERGDAVLPALRAAPADLLISDINMPGLSGLEALEQIRAAHEKLPVIIMTGQGTMATAIEAMRRGAFEYMLKPFEPDTMLANIRRALEVSRLQHTPVRIAPEQIYTDEDALVGASPAMQEVFKAIGKVAGTDAAVLIRGENGTGKELVARALYQFSRRAKGPLVVVNCAAIPETLLESEFFGHEKGAFTGADHRRIGRFEQAEGGTIFLDEIGEIPPGTQAKLLRVLQEKTIERVGGREPLKVNVRVVSATNRDLEAAIAQGEFREDLYHRLNVFTIHLPPLRERPGDLPLLARHFIGRFAQELEREAPTLPAEALQLLAAHSWSGNVRELQHTVQRAMILAQDYPLSADFFRQALQRPGQPAPAVPGARTPDPAMRPTTGATAATGAPAADPAAGPPATGDLAAQLQALALRLLEDGAIADRHGHFLDAADRALLVAALEKAGGNQSQAARLLGLSRQAIQMKLNKYNIAR